MTTLPDIIGEFTSDAISLVADAAHITIPGAAVAGGAVTRFLRRRTEAARDILLDELRRANITDVEAASEDDAVGVVYRYLRAAQEGAARLNLRLLAKVIVGQFEAGRLMADEFLQYAESLAALSRDEIIVIGTMYRAMVEQLAQMRENPATFPNGIDPWAATKRALAEKGWEEDRVAAAGTRSQRSGLVVGHAAYGGMIFSASPMLTELGKTVDFDDALRREEKGAASR